MALLAPSSILLSEGSVPVAYKSVKLKIFERTVADQVTVQQCNNNLFDNFQSGFCSCHSTETALTRVVNDLYVSADSGSASLILLLDLSVAFDTVDHSVLLHRLEHCVGVHGQALSWSYLSKKNPTC